MAHLVAKHSANSQQKQKLYYDRGAKSHSFEVGDQVLVLLPTTMNRLKLWWTGPYNELRKVSTVDYEVKMPGRGHEKKVYHVNLIKKWYDMASHPQALLSATDCELMDDVGESGNTEWECWPEEVAD